MMTTAAQQTSCASWPVRVNTGLPNTLKVKQYLIAEAIKSECGKLAYWLRHPSPGFQPLPLLGLWLQFLWNYTPLKQHGEAFWKAVEEARVDLNLAGLETDAAGFDHLIEALQFTLTELHSCALTSVHANKPLMPGLLEKFRPTDASDDYSLSYHVQLVSTSDANKQQAYFVSTRIGPASAVVLRSHKQFEGLHQRLSQAFPLVEWPALSGSLFRWKPQRHRKRSCRKLLRFAIAQQPIRDSPVLKEFLFSNKCGDKAIPPELKSHDDWLIKLLTQRQQLHFIIERQLADIWPSTMEVLEIVTSGDLALLASLLSEATSVDSIQDPRLASLFTLIQLRLSYYLFGEFHASPEAKSSLKKLRRLYNLTPFTPLAMLVKVMPSPESFISGALTLILTKPLGSQSILQRILALELKQETMEQETVHLASDFPAETVGQMKWLVETTDRTQLNSLDPDRVAQMFKELDVPKEKLYELLSLLASSRDRAASIDLLGRDSIVNLIKQGVPVFTKPLWTTFCLVEPSKLIFGAKATMSQIIEVSEKYSYLNEGSKDSVGQLEVFRAFESLVLSWRADLFTLMKKLIVPSESNQEFRELLQWLFQGFGLLRSSAVAANAVNVTTSLPFATRPLGSFPAVFAGLMAEGFDAPTAAVPQQF